MIREIKIEPLTPEDLQRDQNLPPDSLVHIPGPRPMEGLPHRTDVGPAALPPPPPFDPPPAAPPGSTPFDSPFVRRL